MHSAPLRKRGSSQRSSMQTASAMNTRLPQASRAVAGPASSACARLCDCARPARAPSSRGRAPGDELDASRDGCVPSGAADATQCRAYAARVRGCVLGLPMLALTVASTSPCAARAGRPDAAARRCRRGRRLPRRRGCVSATARTAVIGARRHGRRCCAPCRCASRPPAAARLPAHGLGPVGRRFARLTRDRQATAGNAAAARHAATAAQQPPPATEMPAVGGGDAAVSASARRPRRRRARSRCRCGVGTGCRA